jgi:CubicO group peptidase (beta-lactamase class C family)
MVPIDLGETHQLHFGGKAPMKTILAVLSALLLVTTNHAAEKAAGELPRSRPEAQGISPSAILAFVEEADRKIDSLHSFMLVRHGHVVAECWWNPYDAQTRHELYSLSKSFTSTAVGLAIAEGKLSIDDPVLKFFPEDAPEKPSNNLKAMRVHDLLRMATGHQSEPRLISPQGAKLASEQVPWVKTFLAHPVPFKPGTHFLYNTAGTYMQSAIVQKATGQTVLDYLRPRLFEPLGIDNPTWGTSPQGISLGGYGLSIRTEDIAKFGQLYLQKGQWHGKRLIPAKWVEAATALQTSNGSNPNSDWDQGYGYQFWRARHGAYRGDGAFGQFCVVLPKLDAVVAITSGTRDMQAVLNLVWDKLLPAMNAEPVTVDDENQRKLQARMKELILHTPNAAASARLPEGVSGTMFNYPTNDQKLESLGLEFEGANGPVTLVCKFNGHEAQRIPCGKGEWKKGRLAIGRLPDQPAAATGAWTGDNVYTARICLYETPFVFNFRLHFDENKLRLNWTQNVSFGPATRGELVGEKK